MSNAQIKKKFEEFETYLGRDVVGLEKLKSLKDAVNVQRKALASAESRGTTQAERAEVLHAQVCDLDRQNREAAAEIHRLQQIVSNLTRELDSANASARVTSEEESVGTLQASTSVEDTEIKRVVKRLRKRLKHCPRFTRRSCDTSSLVVGGAFVFDRESFAEGWSHEAIWTLGASMAVLSSTFGVVVLETKRLMTDVKIKDPNKDLNSDENIGRHIVGWLNRLPVEWDFEAFTYGFEPYRDRLRSDWNRVALADFTGSR